MRRFTRHAFVHALMMSGTIVPFLSCSSTTTTQEPVEFTAVTYNAHYMEHGVPGLFRTLQPLQADVIAMQEVLVAGGTNTATSIASGLGYRMVASTPYVGYGHHQWVLVFLTPHPVLMMDERQLGYSRRGLRVTLSIRGRRVQLVTLHLTPFTAALPLMQQNRARAADRQREIADLLAWIGTPSDPVIILGDFNMLRGPISLLGFDEYATMSASPFSDADGGLLPFNHDTFPVDEPTREKAKQKLPGCLVPSALTLDYIFHSPEIKPLRTDVPRSDASDHWPLVARLRLTRP